LIVASVAELKPSAGVLSFFSNEQGGVKDDLIIHNYQDKSLHIVANAGCADKDVAHLKVRLAMCRVAPVSLHTLLVSVTIS
jgi:aminomethyltransferase